MQTPGTVNRDYGVAGSDSGGGGAKGAESGGLGGFQPDQRKVRDDLRLFDRLIGIGHISADQAEAMLSMCAAIRKDGNCDRDKMRAAELEVKLMALGFSAAQEACKQMHLANGEATENVTLKMQPPRLLRGNE